VSADSPIKGVEAAACRHSACSSYFWSRAPAARLLIKDRSSVAIKLADSTFRSKTLNQSTENIIIHRRFVNIAVAKS
jgi:hypothetical protein